MEDGRGRIENLYSLFIVAALTLVLRRLIFPGTKEQDTTMNAYSALEMKEALDKALVDSPQSKNVLESFSEILLEKQKLKERLMGESEPAALSMELENFKKGHSLLGIEGLLPTPSLLMEVLPEIMETLIRAFPNARDGLNIIHQDMLENKHAVPAKTQSVVSGNVEATEMISNELGVDPQLLIFCYTRLLKPFAEAKAVSTHDLINGLEWPHEYCPVCGGRPLMGFLSGDGGKRSLVCGLCEYEWSFHRLECAFCGNSEQETLEQIFLEDREHERVDLCGACKGYIKTIDLRDRIGPIFSEVLHISTLHLDIMARERGFSQPGRL